MGDCRWKGDRVDLKVVLSPESDGKFKAILKEKTIEELDDSSSDIGPTALLGNK